MLTPHAAADRAARYAALDAEHLDALERLYLKALAHHATSHATKALSSDCLVAIARERALRQACAKAILAELQENGFIIVLTSPSHGQV